MDIQAPHQLFGLMCVHGVDMEFDAFLSVIRGLLTHFLQSAPSYLSL
jgi:hypothetical protein